MFSHSNKNVTTLVGFILLSTLLFTAAICEGVVLNVPSMGGNLEGNKDWSRNPNFIDAIKQCRKFGSAATPWDEAAPVDADGWPIQSGGQGVGSVIFTDQEPGTFSGTYYLELSGKATVSLVSSPDCSLNSVTYNSATGKTTGNVVVGPTAYQLMMAFKMDVDGPVRNIRLIRPGYTLQDADTTIFTSTLLNQIQNYKILRFMDWGETNNNALVSWSERPKVTDATWTIHGVPYEIMIALGNRAGKDIWVNVPAKVDDDYITQMATLFNAQLTTNVYVEYSNELWNGQFSQTAYNIDQAEQMVANGQTFLNWDNINDKYTWSFRRTGYKLMLISNIFANVFGESKRNTQFRCVLAGQGANIYILNEGLNIVDKFFGAPSQFFYAVAQAPYFQLPNKNETLNKNQVLQKLTAESDKSPNIYQYMQHLIASRWNKLKLVAYEGGPDTFGPYNVAAKRQATWDPRMKQISLDYLKYWFSYGFDTFVWFTIGAGSYQTPHGTWPLVENINQVTSPKKEAIDFYAVNNAGVAINSTVFTNRCPDEVTNATILNIPAVDYALSTETGTYISAPAVNSLYHYPVVFTKKGNYNITVETATIKANSYIGIYMDGVKLGSVLSNSGGSNIWKFSVNVSVPMVTEPKLALVSLKCESDRAYNIRTVRVKRVVV